VNSALLAVLTYVGFIVAYHTYGRRLGRVLFGTRPDAEVPSRKYRDDVDFVPTKKEVLFGHHFTSIAGTGPIVGPAIGVIWGWVPALLWVFFGSIFLGAVHDFTTLMVSARSEGHSIGDLTRRVISRTSQLLFLLIIFFVLLVVVALFALIIGLLFTMYPESVIPIWVEIPIAVTLGVVVRRGANLKVASIIALVLLYVFVYVGTLAPVRIPESLGNPLMLWVLVLFAYGYVASVLPVQALLQPRDYINSHQLFAAGAALLLGLFLIHPPIAAPAVRLDVPNAPPLMPFLFIIVACGAISGFHSLVSSGTSVKQLASERDAPLVGYGSMLTEGALAVLVILACTAGVGGHSEWMARYADWSSLKGLGPKVGAFVDGGATFVAALGIPLAVAKTVLAVFVVSFAGTTIDTATRIQRLVVSELGSMMRIRSLENRFLATAVAVLTAMGLAFAKPGGKGALVLWPMFGAINQLLAGLALLVVTVYLARKGKPIIYTGLPMIFMIVMTFWAMIYNLRSFIASNNWLLTVMSVLILALEIWMVIEAVMVIRRLRAADRALAFGR
jgi:carbon starvation protein